MSTPTSLYLDFLFDGGTTAQALGVLTAAIEAAPIASVLIRAADGTKLDIDTARTLVSYPQKKDIAVLVTPGAGDAAKLGADGVHLLWSTDIVSQFKTTKENAKRDAMVAADAGRSRHDAMEIGEAGADYVAFGIPPHVEDRAKAAERQLELIAWWSELFEVPCVAFDVPDPEVARELAVSGADFVSVRVRSLDPAADAAARVRAFSEAVRIAEPVK